MKIGYWLVSLLCFWFIWGCSPSELKGRYHAEKGVLNLSGYHPQNDGNIRLDGYWEIYRNRLLSPLDFDGIDSSITDWVRVPNQWDRVPDGGFGYTATGYATYRLKIINLPTNQHLSLIAPHQFTAFRLWVNGELRLTNGIVAESFEKTIPQYRDGYFRLESDSPTLDIVLQIANFHLPWGGFRESIILGGEQKIFRRFEGLIWFEWFTIGAIVFLVVYYLFLFILKKKDYLYLFFGLSCLAMVIRLSVTGSILFTLLFPDLSWEVLIRIEYISFYITLALLFTYYFQLFRSTVHPITVNLVWLVSLGFSIVALLNNAIIHTQGIYYYQGFAILAMVYILIAMVRAALKGEAYARSILIASLVLFIGVCKDIFLPDVLILNLADSMPIALFIFIVLNAVVLSMRIIRLQSQSEKLSLALSDQVRERTAELESTNFQLKLITEIGRKITSTLDMEEIFSTVYESVNSLMDASSFGIKLHKKDEEAIDHIYYIENGVRLSGFKTSMNSRNSLSAWCIRHGKVIFTNDLVKDYRQYVAKLTVVEGETPNSVIYCPLIFENQVVGAMIVQTVKKDAYTTKDLNILTSLSAYIAIALNNSIRSSELETEKQKVVDQTKKLLEKDKVMQKDLSVAENIQKNILPAKIDKIKGLNFYNLYIPLEKVGGDIYDVVEVAPGRIRVFLADATGHGIPAALVTMIIKGEYEKLKSIIQEPQELLEFMNREFMSVYYNITVFFTCIIADIDLNDKKLYYANAGHPEQYYISGKKITRLGTTGKMIGIMEDIKYNQIALDLDEKFKLFFYTDGLTEEFNKDSEEYGEERLLQSIEKNASFDISLMTQMILKSVYDYIGKGKMNDDITIVAVEKS